MELADMKRDYNQLVNSDSTFRVDQVPSSAPEVAGVYVLSERGSAVYVGRTGNLRKRLADHRSSSVMRATLAVKMARVKAKKPATYRPGSGAKHLFENCSTFRAEFEAAMKRVRTMQVRYFVVPEDEDDGVRQALLEIYAAVELPTLERDGGYNDFKNH